MTGPVTWLLTAATLCACLAARCRQALIPSRSHPRDVAQVLIIDEVSMISAELFHLLEVHMRQLRHNDQPFGGVQLILAGDYFQCALFCTPCNVRPKLVQVGLRPGGSGQRSFAAHLVLRPLGDCVLLPCGYPTQLGTLS